MGLSRPKLIVASITPYFLEKGNVWFEENFQKVEQKVKGGMDKNSAGIEVMKKYEQELKKLV